MRYFVVVAALAAVVVGGERAAAQAVPAAKAPPAAAPARGRLSSDPAQFMLDVQAMLASTNNAPAKAVGAQLQQLWGGGSFTAPQQARIVALSQAMLAKKFRPRPQFETFFRALIGGATTAKLGAAQLDQYLDVLGQTLDKEPAAETDKFLVSSSRFLNGGYLYRSGFNSLRAAGGTVSFAYSPVAAPVSTLEFGAAAPAKDEPLPAAKPVAKAAAKPAAKAAPKPVAKKKKSSSGWDTSDLWSSPAASSGWGDKDDGWGKADDGWGAPAKKKAPAKKAVAKAGAKAPAAAKPVATAPAEPAANPADFAPSTAGFEPTAGYDAYSPPPTRGAVLVVKDADLYLATAGDSVVLRQVSGTAVPGTSRFVGTGGQFAWTVKNNPVTAALSGFDFDLSKPEFTAQPVTLTYAAQLEAPVKGALSYRSVRRKPGATDTGYPRFISLTNDARLKNLGGDISYRGGVSLAGERLLSAALDGSLATLTVSEGGQRKFRAASRAYVLSDSVVTAGRAAVAIYEGQDSLTHPGVQVRYLRAKQQLRLSREDGLYKNTPFNDSYHKLEIRSEQLTWDLHQPSIDFAVLTAKNQQTADFESQAFYTDARYQQIKSINRLHPLQMLVGYSQAHANARTLNVADIATDLSTAEGNLRSAMAGLARDGYVQWNGQTGNVTILPKGLHYVAAARDRKDYDHLAIKSLSGAGRNATLNLATNELLIRGVDRFNFTDDSLAVYVRPDSSVVRVQKNRNIKFSGTVVAAAMRFKGKEFAFDYDGFYVDMAKIDSMVIRSQPKQVAGKRNNGKHFDFALTNKGKVSSGRLFLNDPQNKSGRKKKPNFPAFDSKTGASVFFGKQDVLGGAYDSTMVFDIPPFRLDSLNSLGQTATGFDGTFRSGGIIPDIKTKLTAQPDGSLGFVYDVPKDGFPLYKGKGRVFNKVKLDSRGLQADGTVKYQSGTFTSDRFTFYRDSVVTEGKTGELAARNAGGVNSPRMALPPGYLMNWVVQADSMYLTTPRTGAPIKLYANDAYSFRGRALLTPKGTGGNGRLDGPQSFIKSPDFTFKTDGYSGRKATLSVKSAEVNKPALTANEVAFQYDLKKGYADFTREPDSKASIDLPYSQFKTTLSGGRWDFKKKLVQLRVAPGADSTASYFYATGEAQHGLKFRAATGVYDLAHYRLQAGGVPYVAAADAWIVPDSGRVVILANAQLKTLHNAKVVLDSLAKFHRLYNGNITVASRLAFSGDALYSFKTATDSVALRFTNFASDSVASVATARKGGGLFRKKAAAGAGAPGPAGGLATVATASVQTNAKFSLAPRIGYRGDMQLNSQRRGLAFTGEVQLQFGKNYATSAGWFPVKDSIDPKNVVLTLPDTKAKGESEAPMLTGLFLSDQSNSVFPLFAAALPNEADVPLFTVDGKLRYDAKRGLFTISRNDLADPNRYDGAVLTYKDSTGQMGFRGPMTFIKSSKEYRMVGSGVGVANPDSAAYRVDALLGLDMVMPAKALEVLGAEMVKVTKGSPEALDGSANELYKLGEFVGSKGIEAYAGTKGQAISLAKLSPKLAHTLLLSRVNLRWNAKKKAWYSVGKIGVAGVGKQSLNALVDGYVEIKRSNSTDEVEIYLEPGPQDWYYFKYANNLLLTKSQSDAYDGEITRAQKGDYNTALSYGVFLGDFGDVDGFRSRFQRDYLGMSGKLAARAAAPSKPDEPTVDTGKKKKKKKGDDAFGTDGTEAAATAAPAPEPSGKKKKKAKDNDPFGSGDLTEVPPAADAPKKKKDQEKAAAATETPAEAPAAEPSKKKKGQEAAATEATDPAAAPPAEQPSKKKKKDKEATAADAEPAPADAPVDEAPKKKKKKKGNADDPFGDS
ncbi:hypothetical protein ACFQ48_20375 [Hymenobacter caeli]|uniref:Translocation/assembly module TamB n=1 Tax=Hymenobacter caeli TaxID=2735894 RepID=A0ABX2FVP1_9BACT|nr:hypothetical protein [Hymenobacter caeli]NRT21293.1 hypothetical protein [Hymenobacter caeli]